MTHSNSQKLTPLDKVSQSTIYSKACPKCKKDNLEDAGFCWNCGFEFPETADWNRPERREKVSFSGAMVQIAFVLGIIVIGLIILDIIR